MNAMNHPVVLTLDEDDDEILKELSKLKREVVRLREIIIGSERKRNELLDNKSLRGRAQLIYGWRRYRDKVFQSPLFGEPVFDMLLDLYVSHCDLKDISVSSLTIAGLAAPTTSLRYIAAMEAAGYCYREDDPLDRRRVFVRLSKRGQNLMERVLTYYDDF